MDGWAPAAVQTPTASVPGNSINNPFIFTGTQATNVVNLSSLTETNGNFTLNGTANQVFVINASGNITINGPSSILLSGGVTANHVFFNVTGTGGVTFTGIGSLNGTFVDLGGSISVHDKTLNGALIGGAGSISDTSGFVINHMPFVPEPSGVALLGLGLGAGALGTVHNRLRSRNVAA